MRLYVMGLMFASGRVAAAEKPAISTLEMPQFGRDWALTCGDEGTTPIEVGILNRLCCN